LLKNLLSAAANFALPNSTEMVKNYYYSKRPGYKSKIYRALIRLMGIKTKLRKAFKTGDFSKAHTPAAIPESVKDQCDVLYRKSPPGRTIWELKKKNTRPQRYIFFLHGGGFVANITKFDWHFLNKIIQHTGHGIVAPDYPLVPVSNYKNVFEMVTPAYEELLQQVGSENVTLMGFSAGGGLTFSLAQFARNNQLPNPAQIILLSPLLDGSISNPEIMEIDRYDPYIDVEGFRKAISVYAANTSISDYMISSIHGDLEGLAPIHLFAGTHEVLLPDARKLAALAKEKNITLNYYEYNQMYHAWIFLNMREARDVFSKLIHILK
jgi:acetyl esterase/lipase